MLDSVAGEPSRSRKRLVARLEFPHFHADLRVCPGLWGRHRCGPICPGAGGRLFGTASCRGHRVPSPEGSPRTTLLKAGFGDVGSAGTGLGLRRRRYRDPAASEISRRASAQVSPAPPTEFFPDDDRQRLGRRRSRPSKRAGPIPFQSGRGESSWKLVSEQRSRAGVAARSRGKLSSRLRRPIRNASQASRGQELQEPGGF